MVCLRCDPQRTPKQTLSRNCCHTNVCPTYPWLCVPHTSGCESHVPVCVSNVPRLCDPCTPGCVSHVPLAVSPMYSWLCVPHTPGCSGSHHFFRPFCFLPILNSYFLLFRLSAYGGVLRLFVSLTSLPTPMLFQLLR